MKKALFENVTALIQKEQKHAAATLAARAMLNNATKAEAERLTKRHEEFTGRPAFKADAARIEKIAAENMKAKRARVNKILAAMKPVYYAEAMKPVYTAYVNALSVGNAAAFAEAKTALKAMLLNDYEENYSLKTCELLLAAVGLTRGNVSERAAGLVIKPRSAEDFGRMLISALYTQCTKEGRKLSAAKAAAIIEALNNEEAEAEAEIAAVVAE